MAEREHVEDDVHYVIEDYSNFPSARKRQTILRLIEDRPHIASCLTEASVNTQAMVNMFNRLMP